MTTPMARRIRLFLPSFSSQSLLRKRQTAPPMTSKEITPIMIKDIDTMFAIDQQQHMHTQQILKLLTIIVFIFAVNTVKLPCEYNSQTWEPQNFYQLFEREILVSTRYGFDMIIDAYDETVSQAIRNKGMWNSQMVHMMALFLQQGSTVLNLGPQTGLEAIIMGKIIGPKGKMYLFEPYKTSFVIVKKNIYLNDLEDITKLYKVGASDSQSEQKMLIYPENTGAAEILNPSMFPDKLSTRNFFEETIRVDTVDNVLPLGLKLDFALIDVEKMEVEALLGMKKIIQRSQNLIMLVQWQYKINSHRNQQKTIRCINWLTKIGFKFYTYKPPVQNKCQIGQFHLIEEPMSLLNIEPNDILIVPRHLDPNSYKK